MNANNQPSTSQVLQACQYVLPSCLHIEAITIEYLTSKLESASDHLTPNLFNAITIQHRLVPADIRLVVRLVNHRFVFMRYSFDLSKFHCLNCKTTGHCRHWVNLRGASDVDQDSAMSLQKAIRVDQEILSVVDGTGNLYSQGKSQIKYPIYTTEQKRILASRQLWVEKQMSALLEFQGKTAVFQFLIKNLNSFYIYLFFFISSKPRFIPTSCSVSSFCCFKYSFVAYILYNDAVPTYCTYRRLN